MVQCCVLGALGVALSRQLSAVAAWPTETKVGGPSSEASEEATWPLGLWWEGWPNDLWVTFGVILPFA